MPDIHVLVLARRGDPGLPALSSLPEGTRAVVAHSAEEAIPHAAQADAVLAALGRGPLQAVWPHARRLRWVHSRPAGLDHILFPELVASDVVMTNSRGVFSSSLAEFALLGLLFFHKDVRRLLRQQADAQWQVFEPGELRGRTLGIVGYGDIGRAVAAVVRPLGVRIVALRRRPAPDPLVDEMVPADRLLDMLSRVDDVVVAAPLTADTHHLVGESAFRALRPGGVIVNVGRGPVVDETSLMAALDQGRLLGAALDVFEQEPLPPDHPFWRMDNVLVSPHTADHTAGWEANTMPVFVENLRRFRDGEPLLNRVDKRLGY
jgi:phosphoglycerate dehydrogenase-like enzyme